jgi:hypothetical protein
MRYFFRRRIPVCRRILIIESGSRAIVEKLLPALRAHFGEDAELWLVTCYAGLPAGFPETTRVFRVSDYQGRAGRKRLYAELAGCELAGLICSDEPVMTRWKWAIAAHAPAKIFLINENGDFFWFDYTQWRIITYFALHRSGLAGPGALRNMARLALFPFTLGYLLLFAGGIHLRRFLRHSRAWTAN